MSMTSDYRVIFSDQFNCACISVEMPNYMNADALIAICEDAEAILHNDGVEYVVELRPDVGPELWTEDALRRSVGKDLQCH